MRRAATGGGVDQGEFVFPASELAAERRIPLPRRDAAAAEARTRVQPLAAVAVAAALAIGLGLRLWGINAVGFNSDEAVYAGQAAALAGDQSYTPFFAIFRAHPLLVQFLIALVFKVTVSDVLARLVMVAIGLAAIPLIYLLGAELFSRRVGALAALILAVLPYHVVVTRQVLLDGPETTLFLLTMYLLVRYVTTSSARFLYVAGFAAGLTFLAKETGILVVFVIGVFAIMTPTIRLGRRLLGTLLAFAVGVAPYPISILLSGASDTARQFLIWQLLRRPNHDPAFYLSVAMSALGPVLLATAAVGLLIAVRRVTWQDRLLLAWLLVPLAFFEIWPVKGFQYLLPIAPAAILLAARAVVAFVHLLANQVTRRRADARPVLSGGLAFAVVALVLVTVTAVPSVASGNRVLGSLAGTGGLPGGREAGQWIDGHTPYGSSFMTIGPTMANVIQFYGHRRAQGLSVSPNPLHRNPAYEPILNADEELRNVRIQYIAWDLWSGTRSPHFADMLMGYVSKYHGVLIYEQRALVRDSSGQESMQTVLRVYEVRP